MRALILALAFALSAEAAESRFDKIRVEGDATIKGVIKAGPEGNPITDEDGNLVGGGGGGGSVSFDATNNAEVSSGVVSTTVAAMVEVKGVVVNSSTAGSVKLKWAQGSSNGTATTIKTNSYLVAHEF